MYWLVILFSFPVLDDTPTAQNQMRPAAALLKRASPTKPHAAPGVPPGPFANDPEIRLAAAHALLAAGHAAGAVAKA